MRLKCHSLLRKQFPNTWYSLKLRLVKISKFMKMNPSVGANEKETVELLFYDDSESGSTSPFCILDEVSTTGDDRQMEDFDLQIRNQLRSSKIRIPQSSFDPNSFSNILTYDQATVTVDGKTTVRLGPRENEELVGKITAKFLKTPGKNVDEVKKILTKGCFCVGKNCYDYLDPEIVYRHRLNISNLDRTDHNMFLMGAVVTCLMNYNGLMMKSYMKYTFQGKRVCKDAFLYLQCCTSQQLNNVRDHLLTYGISPFKNSAGKKRNQGLFFHDMYKSVKEFLSKYIEKHLGKKYIEGERCILPWGTTKKSLHQLYKLYIYRQNPCKKFMAYSTFRNFLIEHFPHIIFYSYGGSPERKAAPSQTQHRREEEQIVKAENIQIVSPFEVIPPLNHVPYPNQDSSEAPDLLISTLSTNSLENSDTVGSSSADEAVER